VRILGEVLDAAGGSERVTRAAAVAAVASLRDRLLALEGEGALVVDPSLREADPATLLEGAARALAGIHAPAPLGLRGGSVEVDVATPLGLYANRLAGERRWARSPWLRSSSVDTRGSAPRRGTTHPQGRSEGKCASAIVVHALDDPVGASVVGSPLGDGLFQACDLLGRLGLLQGPAEGLLPGGLAVRAGWG